MRDQPNRYEFCRVYVRDLDEAHVALLLPEPGGAVEVEVRRSEDWTRGMDPADFVVWPTNVEVHQGDGAEDHGIVATVRGIIDVLRGAGIDVVASADFEDELA